MREDKSVCAADRLCAARIFFAYPWERRLPVASKFSAVEVLKRSDAKSGREDKVSGSKLPEIHRKLEGELPRGSRAVARAEMVLGVFVIARVPEL